MIFGLLDRRLAAGPPGLLQLGSIWRVDELKQPQIPKDLKRLNAIPPL